MGAIRDAWRELEATSAPPEASDGQRRDMRNAFYVGAGAMLKHLLTSAGADGSGAVLDALVAELAAFDPHAPPEPRPAPPGAPAPVAAAAPTAHLPELDTPLLGKPPFQQELEGLTADLARLCMQHLEGLKVGFALFTFTFAPGFVAYASNGSRADMIRLLERHLAAAKKAERAAGGPS